MTAIAQPGSTLGSILGEATAPRVERPPLITPEGRASFAYVLRPQQPRKPTEKLKYSLTILFPKGADLSALIAEVKRVAVEKFPDPATRPKIHLPFRDQGELKYPGYEAGAVFIRASNEKKPGVIDARKNPIVNEADFYSGCYVRAHIHAFYYDNNGNKGISFGLDNVQKIRDGEPLGGRMKAEDVFGAVEGAGDAAGLTASDIFG